MKRLPIRPALAVAAVTLLAALPALAQELRVQCYPDGNECEVTGDLARRFEAANAGAKIVIDKVPYKAVVEQLPVQLAAGEGPDIARVADLGGLNKYYLDLTPERQGLSLDRGAGGLQRDARRRGVRRVQARQAAGAGGEVPRFPRAGRELQRVDVAHREHPGQRRGGEGGGHVQGVAARPHRPRQLRGRCAPDRRAPLRAAGLPLQPRGVPADRAAQIVEDGGHAESAAMRAAALAWLERLDLTARGSG
jgi:hypothetical protein